MLLKSILSIVKNCIGGIYKMSSVTIFKGTPSERTVTPEEVENLYKHALDAFDELNVYKEVHEKWGVQL